MKELLTALMSAALRNGSPLGQTISIIDFKMSTTEIDEDYLSQYVDIMKTLSLLHCLINGVDASSYETFNLDKIEMLRDPKIAKIGLPRFQEKRKADLLKIEPDLQSIYDSFIAQLSE